MRSSSTIAPLTLAFVLVLAVSTASAQPELSAGYQFLRLSGADESPVNFAVGLAADYAHPLKDRWAVVGQLDWTRRSVSGTFSGDQFGKAFQFTSTLTQVSMAAGLRYGLKLSRVTPYVQALGGITRSSASAEIDGAEALDEAAADLMLQPGVGAAVMVNEKWSGVGQVDYRSIFTGDNSDIFFKPTVRGLRLFLGVRFRPRAPGP